MLHLSLAILFTSLLIIIFNYFKRFGVKALHAIVVNYWVAGSLGLLYSGNASVIFTFPQYSWFIPTIMLGWLFFTVFNTISFSTQKTGVSITTVANKMSLIIPVTVAIWIHHDPANVWTILGIALALIAVVLSSLSSNPKHEKEMGLMNYFLPLLVFVGSGLVDASVNFIKVRYVPPVENNLFTSLAFYAGGLTGAIVLLVQWYRKKEMLALKSVIAGIILGIPNFYSIYFLLKALESYDSNATVYSILNIGVVIFSVIYARLFFKEPISKLNWIGIVLSLISILLLSQ